MSRSLYSSCSTFNSPRKTFSTPKKRNWFRYWLTYKLISQDRELSDPNGSSKEVRVVPIVIRMYYIFSAATYKVPVKNFAFTVHSSPLASGGL